jgi:hypothetical protein
VASFAAASAPDVITDGTSACCVKTGVSIAPDDIPPGFVGTKGAGDNGIARIDHRRVF